MLFATSEVTFTEEILESPRTVLVHFWAPWCKICHRIEPMLLKLQERHPETVQLASVNADDNLKLVTTYRVKILPTILVFKQGQVIHRLDGFQGRDETMRSLEQVLTSRIVTTA